MRQHSSPTAVADSEAQGGAAATSLHQVAPVHYHHLRMLAECAAGLEQDTDFVFTGDGTLQITPGQPAGAVLVPARGAGKYPRNVVRLHTAPGEDGSVEEMRLEHGTADALFWSDSAVHKFVVPYVASCACHDAPQTLGKLISAWNHYPADRVTVHALAHVRKDGDGIPLAMENRIHVVYAERQGGKEGTSLARAPLAEFVKAYPPAHGRAGAGDPVGAAGHENGAGSARRQVAYRRGGESDRSQRPEYTMLRALAEHACALSSEPQYFIFKAGEHGFRQKTTAELPELGPGDLVIPAYTPTVPPQRPRLHGVWCDHEDGATLNVAAGSDAMFWSDGAVEQFMFPYYASKGGLHLGLRELVEMAELWNPAVVRGQVGQESPRGHTGTFTPRTDEEDVRQGSGAPRADARSTGEGGDALRACQEKLRECEQKLRACEEKLRTSAASDVSGSGTEDDGGYWTPPPLQGLPQGTTATAVAEFNGEFNNNYALIHLSTSQYIAENPQGETWTSTWEGSTSVPVDTNSTSYLSPRRDMGLLSSRNGRAQVLRADDLRASRRAPRE